MGQGNQSRGLIIASKNRGWDPTEISGGVDRDPITKGAERTGTGYFSDCPDPQGDHNNKGSMTERTPPVDTRGPGRKPTTGADPFVGKTGM